MMIWDFVMVKVKTHSKFMHIFKLYLVCAWSV